MSLIEKPEVLGRYLLWQQDETGQDVWSPVGWLIKELMVPDVVRRITDGHGGRDMHREMMECYPGDVRRLAAAVRDQGGWKNKVWDGFRAGEGDAYKWMYGVYMSICQSLFVDIPDLDDLCEAADAAESVEERLKVFDAWLVKHEPETELRFRSRVW